jgi:hypothetical protein
VCSVIGGAAGITESACGARCKAAAKSKTEFNGAGAVSGGPAWYVATMITGKQDCLPLDRYRDPPDLWKLIRSPVIAPGMGVKSRSDPLIRRSMRVPSQVR